MNPYNAFTLDPLGDSSSPPTPTPTAYYHILPFSKILDPPLMSTISFITSIN
jgi:hypothetical protein